MKKIIGCKEYNVGDVVYLAHKNGRPTCRAIAIMEDNGRLAFKPLSEQSCYLTKDGLIPFGVKPFIFAKEVEVEEDQP